MRYELDHLTQPPEQAVLGPVQDDEALLLYAMCRVVCARRVIEFGGLDGYSARNFLRAVGADGIVYTVDRNPVPRQAPNHRVIVKQVEAVGHGDFDGLPVDLLFIDCHAHDQTVIALRALAGPVVTKQTLIALHDTGTHPFKIAPDSTEAQVDGGWIHWPDERALADLLCREHGYHRVAFHAPSPPPPLRYRHGLSLLAITTPFNG